MYAARSADEVNAADELLKMVGKAQVVEWQTRTFEVRMEQSVGVRVPPWAQFMVQVPLDTDGDFEENDFPQMFPQVFELPLP